MRHCGLGKRFAADGAKRSPCCPERYARQLPSCCVQLTGVWAVLISRGVWRLP